MTDDARTTRNAHLSDLDAPTWHAIARLRQDVFVVEQDCPYPDLDDRDEEPGTRQFWTTDADGAVVATLRVLYEDGGDARRIGRVATAVDARGRGVMAELLHAAIDATGGRRIEIDAQSYLEDWYGRFGFVRSGDEFVEDGIPHVPMTLAAR